MPGVFAVHCCFGRAAQVQRFHIQQACQQLDHKIRNVRRVVHTLIHAARLAAQNGKLFFCRFHVRCICLLVEQTQRVDHNAVVLRKGCKRIYFLLRNFIRAAIPCCPDCTICKQQNHIVLSCLLFQNLLRQPKSCTRIRLAQIISAHHQRLMDLLFYHFMVFRRKRKIPKCCLRTCSIYDQRQTNLFIIAHIHQHIQRFRDFPVAVAALHTCATVHDSHDICACAFRFPCLGISIERDAQHRPSRQK